MIDLRHPILILFALLSCLTGLSQPPGPPEGEGPPDPKLPKRMSQYIQTRLEMTEIEIQKFEPSFQAYMRELGKILRENRDDRLVLQQQMIELRLRYRKGFRQWLGDKRGDQVFFEEENFRRTVMHMIRERRKQRGGQGHPPGGGRPRFR